MFMRKTHTKTNAHFIFLFLFLFLSGMNTKVVYIGMYFLFLYEILNVQMSKIFSPFRTEWHSGTLFNSQTLTKFLFFNLKLKCAIQVKFYLSSLFQQDQPFSTIKLSTGMILKCNFLHLNVVYLHRCVGSTIIFFNDMNERQFLVITFRTCKTFNRKYFIWCLFISKPPTDTFQRLYCIFSFKKHWILLLYK